MTHDSDDFDLWQAMAYDYDYDLHACHIKS
jgi:hypothetical protein